MDYHHNLVIKSTSGDATNDNPTVEIEDFTDLPRISRRSIHSTVNVNLADDGNHVQSMEEYYEIVLRELRTVIRRNTNVNSSRQSSHVQRRPSNYAILQQNLAQQKRTSHVLHKSDSNSDSLGYDIFPSYS
jgi:hypothetical protein